MMETKVLCQSAADQCFFPSHVGICLCLCLFCDDGIHFNRQKSLLSFESLRFASKKNEVVSVIWSRFVPISTLCAHLSECGDLRAPFSFLRCCCRDYERPGHVRPFSVQLRLFAMRRSAYIASSEAQNLIPGAVLLALSSVISTY